MELKDVLQSEQVTSILLNNCAVMRGKKTGLETQARKENPDLLDLSGDTVHMMTNATEALRSPCSSEVEADFCSDVYYYRRRFFRVSEFAPSPSQELDQTDQQQGVPHAVLVVHYYHVLDPSEERKHR